MAVDRLGLLGTRGDVCTSDDINSRWFRATYEVRFQEVQNTELPGNDTIAVYKVRTARRTRGAAPSRF